MSFWFLFTYVLIALALLLFAGYRSGRKWMRLEEKLLRDIVRMYRCDATSLLQKTQEALTPFAQRFADLGAHNGETARQRETLAEEANVFLASAIAIARHVEEVERRVDAFIATKPSYPFPTELFLFRGDPVVYTVGVPGGPKLALPSTSGMIMSGTVRPRMFLACHSDALSTLRLRMCEFLNEVRAADKEKAHELFPPNEFQAVRLDMDRVGLPVGWIHYHPLMVDFGGFYALLRRSLADDPIGTTRHVTHLKEKCANMITDVRRVIGAMDAVAKARISECPIVPSTYDLDPFDNPSIPWQTAKAFDAEFHSVIKCASMNNVDDIVEYAQIVVGQYDLVRNLEAALIMLDKHMPDLLESLRTRLDAAAVAQQETAARIAALAPVHEHMRLLAPVISGVEASIVRARHLYDEAKQGATMLRSWPYRDCRRIRAANRYLEGVDVGFQYLSTTMDGCEGWRRAADALRTDTLPMQRAEIVWAMNELGGDPAFLLSIPDISVDEPINHAALYGRLHEVQLRWFRQLSACGMRHRNTRITDVLLPDDE